MASASWIVGNDVATTWTSRIAMNMPMHIVAKPIQVRAVTDTAPPGSMVGEWLVIGWSWSMAGEIPQPGQRPMLRTDANRQDREISEREDQSIPRQAEAKWQ